MVHPGLHTFSFSIFCSPFSFLCVLFCVSILRPFFCSSVVLIQQQLWLAIASLVSMFLTASTHFPPPPVITLIAFVTRVVGRRLAVLKPATASEHLYFSRSLVLVLAWKLILMAVSYFVLLVRSIADCLPACLCVLWSMSMFDWLVGWLVCWLP